MRYFLLFDATLWGSISDWFMIAVTAATAYYLYKTLQSQKQVQLTQNKLFEIESIRFRESIKPHLQYKLSELKFHPSDDKKKVLTIQVTNQSDSVAVNFRSLPEESSSNQIFIPFDFPRRNLKREDKPQILHFLIDADSTADNFIRFKVQYEDIAWTLYKQGVVCIHDQYGTEIIDSLPQQGGMLNN